MPELMLSSRPFMTVNNLNKQENFGAIPLKINAPSVTELLKQLVV